jgi:hypothetical protein
MIGLAACGSLAWTAGAMADAVTDWNLIAVQTIGAAVPPRPGPSGIIDMAVVHAAVHDAVQGIEGRYEPYHVQIAGASGSSAAAAATAAYTVLANRFPAQAGSLQTRYETYFTDHGLALSDPGVAAGLAAASGIIALRAGDGAFPASYPPFTGGTDVGMWRPTISYIQPAPSQAAMAAPWLATVAPFTLTSPSQYRAPKPPPLDSAEYARAYDEVKALGARFGSARTAEQTDMAYFWAMNPLVTLNRGLRDIAAAYVPDIADTARLFALVSLAIADSGITAWDSKLSYVLWRPMTAIQEGDNDGNPSTVGDPDWQPLINNPPYPDHTSGLNNAVGAYTRALALFFGRQITFSLTTTNPGATLHPTRTFTRFDDAADECVQARVLLGIHFNFADVDGRKQGRHVAQWAYGHFLRPIVD